MVITCCCCCCIICGSNGSSGACWGGAKPTTAAHIQSVLQQGSTPALAAVQRPTDAALTDTAAASTLSIPFSNSCCSHCCLLLGLLCCGSLCALLVLLLLLLCKFEVGSSAAKVPPVAGRSPVLGLCVVLGFGG